jgi:biotin carboxylase
MSNVVIVDSNRVGIRSIAVLKRLGHWVTFLFGEHYRMWAADPDAARGLAAADQCIGLPTTFSTAEVRGALARILRERPIEVLLCLLDESVPAVAEAARDLGLPFTAAEAVGLARDKVRCRERLLARSIASPRFRVVTGESDSLAAAREFGFPLVLKPRVGGSSRLVAVVHDERDIANYWCALEARILGEDPMLQDLLRRGFLIEEHLDGCLVSAEIAARPEQATLYMLTGRRRSRSDPTRELGGLMPFPANAVTLDRVATYVEQVRRALGFDLGMAHVELVLTGDGPRLVEFNPRMMGGSLPILFDIVCGRSPYLELFDVHAGAPLRSGPLPTRGFAACRKLEARVPGRIRAIPRRLLDTPGLANHLHSFSASFVAGAAYRANDVLARFVVTGHTARAAEELADALSAHLAESSGVVAHEPERLW